MKTRVNLSFNQEDEEQKKVHYLLENVGRNEKAKVVSRLICKYLEDNGITDILNLSENEIRAISQLDNNKIVHERMTSKEEINRLKEQLNNICRLSFLDITTQLSETDIDEILMLITTVSNILMFCAGKSSSPGTTFQAISSEITINDKKNIAETKELNTSGVKSKKEDVEDIREIDDYQSESEIDNISLDMDLVAGLDAFN